ncbi:CBD9-like protein [Mytilinidion resinicola]|uniref:CBD9-like protein n=1 Tax=Mytilinidion resinicola TaxID=574789 RepID=A0A6A6YXP2_9PEZI|nr:CBD9-like protein [Mytilinidion resinicola]KAF2813183.1 CBD9-like protein [Mytilinidion resinicola]
MLSARRSTAVVALTYFVSTLLTFTTAALTPRSNSIVVREESAASAFVYGVDGGNITFAITAVKSNGDIWFHMAAPSKYSYIAFGTGKQMDGSTMWFGYASSDGKGATLSPRTSGDHVEPEYSSKIKCSLVTDGFENGVVNKTLLVNGHCTNFTAAQSGKNGDSKLNFDSTQQSFIFGLGPTSHTLHSNDLDAGIRRHTEYGTFQMDLTKATVHDGDGVTPPKGAAAWTNSNSGKAEDVTTGDMDYIIPVHAVAMCGAFVLLYPGGVLLLRVLEKVMWHAWMQGLATIIAILGVGLGIKLSLTYNHSKSFNAAHQLIGLVVVLACVVQFALGYLHHRAYKRTQRPTPLGRIHRFAGPVILLIGITNGFTGFNFSDNAKDNIWYGAVVAIVLVVTVGLLIWARIRNGRRAKKATSQEFGLPAYEGMRGEGGNDSGGYDASRYGSNVHLGTM